MPTPESWYEFAKRVLEREQGIEVHPYQLDFLKKIQDGKPLRIMVPRRRRWPGL